MNRTIPIFTVQTVLFPRQQIDLDVYEPRHRQLVDDCMQGDGQFGVCLVKKGRFVNGWSMPYEVGTVAKIMQCRDVGLDGLRIKIEAVGRNPFRIKNFIEPSIPPHPDFDPATAEGQDMIYRLYEAAKPGGKMYIRAEVQMLQEIDDLIPLADWERIVSMWKQGVISRAEPGTVTPYMLDGMLERYYLLTETPTTEYLYSLCALASSEPEDLQVLLDTASVDMLIDEATALMAKNQIH